jgi:hypothetical protein
VTLSGTFTDNPNGTAVDSVVDVSVYNGTTLVGHAILDPVHDTWTLSAKLGLGAYNLTAVATDVAGNVSAAAGAPIAVDIVSPSKPVISTIAGSGVESGASVWTQASPTPTNGGIDAYSNGTFTIKGFGLPGDSVTLWDSNHSSVFNTSQITVGANGTWSYSVTGLAEGEHGFQAMQTDLAGNTSPISNKYDVIVDTTAPTLAISSAAATFGKTGTTFTLGGSYADNLTAPGSIKVTIDGATSVAANITNSSASGAWSYNSGALTNAVHYFTVQGTDLVGNLSAASSAWVYGTVGADTMTFGNGSLPTNATITGGGGNDSFSFVGSFGNEKITDFSTSDTLHFQTSEFANLTALLSHAQQVSGNVVITLDAHDALTLLNTKLAALTSNNVHFA